MEEEIAALLLQQKLTLAVAETTTGGAISARLLRVPGSSAYFDRGIVAYSKAAKLESLRLPAEVIEHYGTVSPETTRAMADAIRSVSGTNLGLAESGIAGPIRGRSPKPVGLSYIALAGPDDTMLIEHRFAGDRQAIQAQICEEALRFLLQYLQEKNK